MGQPFSTDHEEVETWKDFVLKQAGNSNFEEVGVIPQPDLSSTVDLKKFTMNDSILTNSQIQEMNAYIQRLLSELLEATNRVVDSVQLRADVDALLGTNLQFVSSQVKKIVELETKYNVLTDQQQRELVNCTNVVRLSTIFAKDSMDRDAQLATTVIRSDFIVPDSLQKIHEDNYNENERSLEEERGGEAPHLSARLIEHKPDREISRTISNSSSHHGDQKRKRKKTRRISDHSKDIENVDSSYYSRSRRSSIAHSESTTPARCSTSEFDRTMNFDSGNEDDALSSRMLLIEPEEAQSIPSFDQLTIDMNAAQSTENADLMTSFGTDNSATTIPYVYSRCEDDSRRSTESIDSSAHSAIGSVDNGELLNNSEHSILSNQSVTISNDYGCQTLSSTETLSTTLHKFLTKKETVWDLVNAISSVPCISAEETLSKACAQAAEQEGRRREEERKKIATEEFIKKAEAKQREARRNKVIKEELVERGLDKEPTPPPPPPEPKIIKMEEPEPNMIEEPVNTIPIPPPPLIVIPPVRQTRNIISINLKEKISTLKIRDVADSNIDKQPSSNMTHIDKAETVEKELDISRLPSTPPLLDESGRKSSELKKNTTLEVEPKSTDVSHSNTVIPSVMTCAVSVEAGPVEYRPSTPMTALPRENIPSEYEVFLGQRKAVNETMINSLRTPTKPSMPRHAHSSQSSMSSLGIYSNNRISPHHPQYIHHQHYPPNGFGGGGYPNPYQFRQMISQNIFHHGRGMPPPHHLGGLMGPYGYPYYDHSEGPFNPGYPNPFMEMVPHQHWMPNNVPHASPGIYVTPPPPPPPPDSSRGGRYAFGKRPSTRSSAESVEKKRRI